MRKLIPLSIVLAATGLVTGAARAESRKESFKLDGYTYVYEVTKDAKGETITGVRYPDRTPFTLHVKSGRVEGVSNGERVTFSLNEARGAAKGAVAQ